PISTVFIGVAVLELPVNFVAKVTSGDSTNGFYVVGAVVWLSIRGDLKDYRQHGFPVINLWAHCYSLSSRIPSTTLTVSTATRVTFAMRSTMYRGLPTSSAQSLGSLMIPDALSFFTWYRSIIHASADREPSMYSSASAGMSRRVTDLL